MRSKFTWMLTLFIALVLQFSYAQEKTITGVVSDQDGLPLPGANVTVKGTTNGGLATNSLKFYVRVKVATPHLQK